MKITRPVRTRLAAHFFQPTTNTLRISPRRSQLPWPVRQWAGALAAVGCVILFALSAAGQPIQPDASPGSNRVIFPQSLKEVGTMPGAALVRSELAPAEAQITLDFSVVLSRSIYLPRMLAGWHIAGAGDFDGDGYDDLVLENTTTGQRAIWFLKNGVFSRGLGLSTVPVAWNIVDH